MFTFSFEDKIKFTKSRNTIISIKFPYQSLLKTEPEEWEMFAPEQGCIELYDQEGACAHLSVGPGFITDIFL